MRILPSPLKYVTNSDASWRPCAYANFRTAKCICKSRKMCAEPMFSWSNRRAPPVDRHLMELLLMMDALKRASAERITAVLPYYGYARQDRKDRPRMPISARLVASLMERAGANRILALDLHAAQIQGFFDVPVDHLFAAPVMVDYFDELGRR